MKLQYYVIDTPFKDTFTISGGRSKTSQPALIVSLSIGPLIGFGEAPAISYYDVTVEKMVREIKAKKLFIEKFALTDPERYWHYLHHLLPEHPFLVCALDMACWDLYGQMERKPIFKLMGNSWGNTPLTDYTIGLDTIDNMVEKVKKMPWPIYKIKLGADNDLDMLQALRKVTDSPFRVDVNGGWSYNKALEMLPRLAELGVELVEQPMARAKNEADLQQMRALYEASVLPLIADESCVRLADMTGIEQCFHGINIKLTKCSGITPARVLVDEARKRNMKVMMGSMNETVIGSAAIAQFLPQLDYVDMDGPLLLERAAGVGLRIDQGKVTLSGAPGLGVRPSDLPEGGIA
ncbi:L-alanine-DL-glutamate epimerase [Arachidicoccus rhizosphaerae]|jgi:L-alanine-DL-glutamate epimerase-like enolase superfamily enzyme|uniref:Dipeptide epimerase n=1 Tax=Arachidicoccus rhizosphaerae TaxID=551991 RepID=A0A1H3Z0E1_9BACT|nr:dipeptide epimerase [Arachidicoccus rhizosphaerae]SEA16888.1 L-alanine-DL-glutamate epimerase [Arachidicoccus rhizosphaerae]